MRKNKNISQVVNVKSRKLIHSLTIISKPILIYSLYNENLRLQNPISVNLDVDIAFNIFSPASASWDEPTTF